MNAPYLRVVGSDGARTPNQPPPAPLKTSFTADELMAMDFPDPKWAVPGMLAEGVSLLAGPPKVGKSWLSLGLGLAVASGQPAFGSIPVQPGPVLYLALEDTPRRLQSRMRKMLAGQPAPAGLTLATACPPIPQGGDEAVGHWLTRNPDARMVVIDVFAKIRGNSPPGQSAYDADYGAMSRVKNIADAHGVAIVLVHHVRKAGSDDFLAEVSGTNGLAGAADATLVLKRARGQADGVLHVTGRDVEESEQAMSFDADTGAWRILDGPAHEHQLNDTRALIAKHVREHPGTGPKDIADAHPHITPGTIRRTCARMAEDGQLTKDPGGRYYPLSGPEQSHPSHRPATTDDQPEHQGHDQMALSHLTE
ncbi:MAG TPA: AAA family ATPase [Streptosporangiaceae bacterium]|jgi:hypothetical protein